MSIHAKLLAAQKAIHAISKTGFNDHFRYAFFEEREVLQVARDALNNAGLAFFYSVEDVSDREVTTKKGNEELITDVRMICTIYDGETGESLTGKAIGRGQDGQDKGINKAIVAGLKYWLLKTLMIPTEDDTERDENTNTEGNHQSRPAPQRQQAPRPAAPRAPHPNSTPVGVKHSNAPDLFEVKVGFGKHKDITWGEVVAKHPDYIDYLFKNGSVPRSLTAEQGQVLRAAVELHREPVAAGSRDVPLNQPDDDLPFS